MKLLTIIFLLAFASSAFAQNTFDLRINEVSLGRDSTSCAWIELFNTAYVDLDLTGLYLTDEMSNLKKFKFPKGSKQTQVAARNYIVVNVDGNSEQGPLYASFDLKKSNVIYLVESNGRNIIDSLSVSLAQPMKARQPDGVGCWSSVSVSTKGTPNVADCGTANQELFLSVDPTGAGMAAISMSVVFSVLLMLALVFTYLGKFFSKKKTAVKTVVADKQVEDKPTDSSDDELAVATAVVLYLNDSHDSSKGVLTIERSSGIIWKNSIK